VTGKKSSKGRGRHRPGNLLEGALTADKQNLLPGLNRTEVGSDRLGPNFRVVVDFVHEIEKLHHPLVSPQVVVGIKQECM
jgi:hypothetical protein